MHEFKFDTVVLPESVERLRTEVRTFLKEERDAGRLPVKHNSFSHFDADFSRRCGERGYIGMPWPKRYGGGERSRLERFVVAEELLAGGAPLGAHWVADRQSGNQILKFGSEAARSQLLPRIAKGELFFAVGMSEPDAGSDLAAITTKGVQVTGGWRITGTKVWTSNAHRAHYLIAFVRTSPKGEDRHAGFTQFIIDLSQPGVTVRPIRNLYGAHDFNEVVFDGYFVPDGMVLGQPGQGWKTNAGELALERSGPDRFLSTFQTLCNSLGKTGPQPNDRSANEVGRCIAHICTLRRMSISIASMYEQGIDPVTEAALVKDMGNTFEREATEAFRALIPTEPSEGGGDSYAELLGMTILRTPGFTLRAGTREILRGVIARSLGVR